MATMRPSFPFSSKNGKSGHRSGIAAVVDDATHTSVTLRCHTLLASLVYIRGLHYLLAPLVCALLLAGVMTWNTAHRQTLPRKKSSAHQVSIAMTIRYAM